jgi:hypothetical protein
MNDMPEPTRIAQQLRQAMDGNAWHGPAVREILAGVTVELALAKSPAGLHSIAEIVMHLIGTQRILLRRLDGDASAIELPLEIEWPAVVAADEATWQETLRELVVGDEHLRERIAAFHAEQLDQPLIPGGSTAYNNFHGYVQHNLYHAAQIGLLKKINGE